MLETSKRIASHSEAIHAMQFNKSKQKTENLKFSYLSLTCSNFSKTGGQISPRLSHLTMPPAAFTPLRSGWSSPWGALTSLTSGWPQRKRLRKLFMPTSWNGSPIFSNQTTETITRKASEFYKGDAPVVQVMKSPRLHQEFHAAT